MPFVKREDSPPVSHKWSNIRLPSIRVAIIISEAIVLVVGIVVVLVVDALERNNEYGV